MVLEELRENPIKYLKTFAMDILVAVVSVAYVFYQMVVLEKTDLDPWILIAQSLVGIICGLVIKQALGENGFSRGYNSVIWTSEEEKYNASCNLAVEYTHYVDNFYLQIEKEKKMNYRRNHLQAVRLKYGDWFDENGNYIGTKENYKKLDFRQKWMLRKCIRVRIYVLNLFSEYAMSSEQDTKREMTDKRQRTRTLFKNMVSAMLIAFIGVYFVPLLTEWSWGRFVGAIVQVSLWVMFGILQLYTNFNFVVQDKVSILKRKKELISRFIKDCEKGLHQVSPYQE